MQLTLALLGALPLGAFAAPLAAPGQELEARGNKLPFWDGKCYSTKKVTKTVTATRKKVLIPLPTVSTVYVFQTQTVTTTLATQTSVFSTTSTLFTTATQTQTQTETGTVTETVTTDVTPSTVTIAADARITPVRSVYPESAKRSVEAEDAQDITPIKRGLAKNNANSCKPSDLKCTTTVVRTKTATSTRYVTSTVKLPGLTITKKRTSTITTTTSVLPVPASTTTTLSTTATITGTITSTAQVTTTTTTTSTNVAGPTPIFYAACGADNLVSEVNGQIVDTLIFADPAGSATVLQAGSPYDCCVACLMTDNCAGSGFTPGICFGLTPDNGCAGDKSSGTFQVGPGSSGSGFTISNSKCGQWKLG